MKLFALLGREAFDFAGDRRVERALDERQELADEAGAVVIIGVAEAGKNDSRAHPRHAPIQLVIDGGLDAPRIGSGDAAKFGEFGVFVQRLTNRADQALIALRYAGKRRSGLRRDAPVGLPFVLVGHQEAFIDQQSQQGVPIAAPGRTAPNLVGCVLNGALVLAAQPFADGRAFVGLRGPPGIGPSGGPLRLAARPVVRIVPDPVGPRTVFHGGVAIPGDETEAHLIGGQQRRGDGFLNSWERKRGEGDTSLRVEVDCRTDESQAAFLKEVAPVAIGSPHGDAGDAMAEMNGDQAEVFAD